MSIKAYKGFNSDMTCRGFQYKEGETYTMDGDIKCCENGFHACENPLDVYDYYSAGVGHKFHEVILDGEISRDNDDSKIAASKITIGAEMDIASLVRAHFECVTSKCTKTKKKTAGDNKATCVGKNSACIAGNYGSANAGNCGSANAGYRGSANAGDCGSANAGDCGSANAGYRGSANAGDCGSANAGYRGSANAGNYGSANAGDCGSANAGYRGSANAGDCGSASVGEHGVAITRNGQVKGQLGAALVLVETDKNYENKAVSACLVDGEKIKADTWYVLKDGEFVEAE